VACIACSIPGVSATVGLSFAKGELVCAMDADTLIEADGLGGTS